MYTGHGVFLLTQARIIKYGNKKGFIMGYTPQEIKSALAFRKVSYDQETAGRIKDFRRELDRKTDFLKKLFDAINEDYRNHSKTENPFSNPMVRETESGITYFEYDMRLPNGIFKNQIEICYEGYFVNYTSMPDVVYESDGRKREDCTKELYAGDKGIIQQILRSYAELTLSGSMIDIEDRLYQALQTDDKKPDWMAIDRKPQTPNEYLESSTRTWVIFEKAFKKSPHPSLFFKESVNYLTPR